MPPGNFTSQFRFFQLRSDDSWFEDLPVISVTAKKSALDLNGSYSYQMPNPRGAAVDMFTQFENQELWFSDLQASLGPVMVRFMAGQVNRIDTTKKFILSVDGRGLSGLFTDQKVNDSWENKLGDFILCDPTFGVIPILYGEDVTTWHAFTDDYDRFDFWSTTRWGAQPAYVDILDGELVLTGNAGATRTVIATTPYNYEVIEFRAKVSSASNTMRFGFTNAGRTEYVQFSLASGAVNCQNADAGGSQSTATTTSIVQTTYNYYRIEWSNGLVRFFVNGNLEVSTVLNVTATLLYPFFEAALTAQLLTLDYMKVITLTANNESYVCKEKIVLDVVQDITSVGNTTAEFTWYIDNDHDFNAYIKQTVASGKSYGLNSSIYTSPNQAVAAIDLNEEAKDLYNLVRVRGGETLTVVSSPSWTDQLLGDGTQTSYALGYKAKKPMTLVQVNGVTIVEDVGFTVTYGLEHTIVKFNSAPGAAQSVNFRYDYYLPIIAESRNSASIAQYDVTRTYSKIDNNITSTTRAQQFSDALLAYFSDPRTVIKITIPLDPTLQIGQTVNIDAPFYGINNTVYEIIEMECTMSIGTWQTKLTLANSEINTSAEIIREILQQIKELTTRGDTNETTVQQEILIETVNFSESAISQDVLICDSFILTSTEDNSKLGRGVILDSFETTPPSWTPTNAVVARSSTQAIVGTYSMLVTPSAASVTLLTTQSFGDLSSYLTNTTGVVGVWVYVATTSDITAMTLRIGSSATDYVEVSGRVFSQAGLTLLIAGWNYVIFRLSTGAVTGSPDWTAVDYERLVITCSGSLTPFYLDYNTVGDGDTIALNGLGYRPMNLTETSITILG